MTRLSRPVLLALAGLLSASFVGVAVPAVGQEGGGSSDQRQGRSSARAAAALANVEAALTRGSASGRDATLALRDLAVLTPELSPSQQLVARSYLDRPTARTAATGRGAVKYKTAEATPACDDTICVHYVTTTTDAPSQTDAEQADGSAGANGIPDYVDLTLRETRAISDQYLAAGYRAPKPDGTKGGDARFDVYLANIGADGTYGYCTSDDPRKASAYDVWSYCVLDDDYIEFTKQNTPIESLRVTAAHEYFHAVQFGYDFLEDAWFQEATAAWIEDEMFPDIDDNRQYLAVSPLTKPTVSLDQFISGGSLDGWHYGVWIFFRYLSERFPTEQGGLPTLIRDFWRQADDAPGGPEKYSWQAITAVLKARGQNVSRVFADFVAANRTPRTSYAEGEALKYPTAPPASTAKLAGTQGKVVKRTLNHLSSATYRFIPKTASNRQLRVTLDMASLTRGSRALITMFSTTGVVTRKTVVLNNSGNATVTVPFGRMKQVDVMVINASGRFTDCFSNTDFSCAGRPLDNNQPVTLTVKPV